MGDPYVKLFSGVDYPILTALDVSKGMFRGTYEGLRGRPAKTTIGTSFSQIVGSAIGRMVDVNDDRTGVAILQGSNKLVSAAVTGLVSGGIDMAMGRGNRMERFIVPVVIDGVVDLAASTIYNNNPRIL
jgi:hypothetical protein